MPRGAGARKRQRERFRAKFSLDERLYHVMKQAGWSTADHVLVIHQSQGRVAGVVPAQVAAVEILLAGAQARDGALVVKALHHSLGHAMQPARDDDILQHVRRSSCLERRFSVKRPDQGAAAREARAEVRQAARQPSLRRCRDAEQAMAEAAEGVLRRVARALPREVERVPQLAANERGGGVKACSRPSTWATATARP